ncbi:GLPGLI family protein [Chryseobacterium sp. C-39]|uniref:GLPGLI family protein n=1 Tax=Chryseobacterium muglaense TaxID=2893752 RepID=A0A9Q3UX91_9FLAO|nr:GLPGLI family protein [Chryseobacterium muglaense]MBD3904972.1 GLPGLI family protein [Chryseobacterium muglaense]MCC9035161.1 GLPGLI family protein [Chryseobacterium muglaense]
MKFLLIFLIVISNLLFSQKMDSSFIECKYLATFLIDTANINTLKKELVSLKIGKNFSLFRSDMKEKADSLSFAEIDKSIANPTNGIAVINTGNLVSAKYVPEVFYSKDILVVYDKILNVTYNYKAEERTKWTFLNETKKIQGYTCKKAIGKYHNKTIIVWYTEEIPISDGPYTFKNLPGLVLEASDSKDYFHFTLESLKRIKKPIKPLEGTVGTEYSKFVKKRTDIFNDPIGAFVGIFGKTPPKQDHERMIKNIRSINNYLD